MTDVPSEYRDVADTLAFLALKRVEHAGFAMDPAVRKSMRARLVDDFAQVLDSLPEGTLGAVGFVIGRQIDTQYGAEWKTVEGLPFSAFAVSDEACARAKAASMRRTQEREGLPVNARAISRPVLAWAPLDGEVGDGA